jgi:hypothetical protein
LKRMAKVKQASAVTFRPKTRLKLGRHVKSANKHRSKKAYKGQGR